jgi:hypothetical protein
MENEMKGSSLNIGRILLKATTTIALDGTIDVAV